MEPQSDVCKVQPAAWREIVPFDGEPRVGQNTLWGMIAAGVDPALAVLPTGYGKTLAACGAYAIGRALGSVNRLLVLVPTDQQRTQWAASAKKNLARFGVDLRLGAYEIEKEARDIRYSHDGHVEVFVATYAQVYTDSAFWSRLMDQGNWMVVFDECHHLSEDGIWARGSHELPASRRLYLTATPVRHDTRSLRGVPTRILDSGRIELVPTAYVSYMDALKEQAVRGVRVFVHHYFVDVERDDGTVERVTTESLRAQGVTDFSSYETKRRLRYCDTYISTILLDMVNHLNGLEIVNPGEHQGLVFAMTCDHARFVSRTLNAIVEPGFSDWIGIARSAQENDEVLTRYTSRRLRCLVQVDKAGEGFDHHNCSVLVFLHLVKSATKNFQQIGRGLRRNANIERFEDDLCAIFASACSPTLDVALGLERASDLIYEEGAVGTGPERTAKSSMRTIPSLDVVRAEFDRVETFAIGVAAAPVNAQHAAEAAQHLRDLGVPGVEAMTPEQLVIVHERLQKKRMVATPSGSLFASESGRLDYARGNVKRAVGLLASNVLKTRTPNGAVFERAELGMTIRSIHNEWIRQTGAGHDASTARDLERKYEWVRTINNQVKAGQVPTWLR